MYNNPMFRFLFIMTVIFISGCATNPEYNPLQTVSRQTFLLNQSGLNQVKVGMKQAEVHNLMGQEIIIGYSYQNADPKGPNPLTIANPYKTSQVKTDKGECTAEYYVTAIHQPDGIVSDDELMPLVFCNGTLTSKGGQPRS